MFLTVQKHSSQPIRSVNRDIRKERKVNGEGGASDDGLQNLAETLCSALK